VGDGPPQGGLSSLEVRAVCESSLLGQSHCGLPGKILARCCHRQLPVLDAFGRGQFIGDLLDNVRLAANLDQGLKLR
jgi:hypothetical protein